MNHKSTLIIILTSSKETLSNKKMCSNGSRGFFNKYTKPWTPVLQLASSMASFVVDLLLGKTMNSDNFVLTFNEFCAVATLQMPTMYFNWCENCNSKSALYVSRTPFSMPIDNCKKTEIKRISR